MHLPPYSPLLADIIWHNIIIPILCGVCGYLLTAYLVIIPSSTAVIYHVSSWVLGYLAHYVVSVAHRSSTSHKIAKLADTGNLSGLTIPIVPSEYPFTLDILLQWMNEGRTEYLGDGMIVRLSKRFGKVNGRRIKTFNTKVLGENSIITFSAHHAHQILSLPLATKVFEKGSKFRERAYSLLGDGVFASDGNVWRLHRQMSRPFFAALAVRSSVMNYKTDDEEEQSENDGINIDEWRDHETPARDRIDTHVIRLMRCMMVYEKEEKGFDIQAMFSDFTMEMTIDLVTGGNGQDQIGEDKGIRPSIQEFAVAFSEAQSILSTRIRIGTLWSLFELTGDKMKSPMKVVRGFVGPLVDEGMKNKGRGRGSLLDHLVNMTDDRKFIEDEVINILIAARDTTTSALSSCVYCLAIYPEMQDKLMRLIHQSSTNPQSGMKIPYMKAFIHEVLRLYPPVPLNIRRSNAVAILHPEHPDDSPLIFPPNTSVILSFALIQRDKDVWGDDAEHFKPERWLDSEGKFKIAIGAKKGFQAFNLGPRTCLGQGFALQSVAHVLMRLLSHASENDCQLLLAPELQPEGTKPPAEWQKLTGRGQEEKCWMTSDMVLNYKGGLWVRWHGKFSNN